MPLSLEEAHAVASGALAYARSQDIHVTVAVVDEAGLLQTLSRMDGAPPLSSQIAEAKAVGAAVWHRDGDALAEMQRERPAFFAQVDRLVRVPMIPGLGSVLMRRHGRVLGAVGVSGARPEQDRDCAEAGINSL